jgi:hypothetical protein
MLVRLKLRVEDWIGLLQEIANLPTTLTIQ